MVVLPSSYSDHNETSYVSTELEKFPLGRNGLQGRFTNVLR